VLHDPATGRANLRDLSVRAALPAALHHQQRMAELLDELRRSAPDGSFEVTLPSGRRVDALDLIRADLLQSGGATLGFVALLAAGPDLAPDGLFLEVPVHLPELSRAARIVRRSGVPVRVGSSDGLRSRVRIRGHSWVKLARAARDAARRPPDPVAVVPDVLVVVQVPHHVGDLAGVARRLRDGGRSVGFLAPDRACERAVVDAGFDVVRAPRPGWARFAHLAWATWSVRARARRTSRRLARRDGAPAERAAFAATVAAVVTEVLPRTLLVAEDADAIVQAGSLRAALVANPYSRVGRTTGRVVRAADLPVVAVEHGSIFPDDPRWEDCPVTAFCTWGASSRRALATCGVPAERIVVTGAPRFDGAPQAAPALAGAARSDERILVATSGPGDHVSLDVHLRFIELLDEAVAATPGIGWTIKLHPKDRVEHYEALARRANVTVVSGDRAGRSSIFDHLALADGLVTVASTTAIDALRARVPVVAVWLTDDQPPEFISRTAARTVADGQALAAAARAAVARELEPPDAEYLVEHFAPTTDATGAVAGVIVSAIDRAPSGQAPKAAR
jgi:hypothetical protein